MIRNEAFARLPDDAAAALESEGKQVGVEQKKKHEHWWQSIPRRLSLTRSRGSSESETEFAVGSPASPTSPLSSSPEGEKWDKKRRFSESSAGGHETRTEMKERWIRNHNVPPEMFIPPWF